MKHLSGIVPRVHSILLRPLLEFFYPPLCLSCQIITAAEERHLCAVCRRSMVQLSPEHALYGETKSKLCTEGIVDELEALFVFDERGAIRNLVHALKYQSRTSVGVMLGIELGKKLAAHGVSGDFLVPIPLHRVKERERGYNQAECIARGVGDVLGIGVMPHIVIRRKYTQTQTLLSIEERKRNMEDAFELRRGAAPTVSGKTCFLVDDVITTGSTILSCASVLKLAGATRVIAVSLALAE